MLRLLIRAYFNLIPQLLNLLSIKQRNLSIRGKPYAKRDNFKKLCLSLTKQFSFFQAMRVFMSNSEKHCLNSNVTMRRATLIKKRYTWTRAGQGLTWNRGKLFLTRVGLLKNWDALKTLARSMGKQFCFIQWMPMLTRTWGKFF